MENWVILTKLFILLYCTVRYTMGDMKNGPLVLLLTLVYLSVVMLSYVVRNEGAKKLLPAASILVLLYSAFSLNPLFLFLFPVQAGEWVNRFTTDRRAPWIPAFLAAAFVPQDFIAEYGIIALLSLAVFTLAHTTLARLDALTRENDELRERNDLLYRRLDREAEYENQVKYLSQLEERNTIAQSIHDKVGHALAGSLIQLEAASMLMDKDREKAGEIIRNVIHILKEGMENIRSTLRSIKPASEQLGINRLNMLLEEFSRSNPVKTHLTYKGSLESISHLQWKIIMDNVKEALTNTLKYSHASSVAVSIEVFNKLIKVETRDNGVGAYTIKKGLGIRGMEERTENAGGKIILDGSKGFSIITLLPTGGNN